MTIWRPSLLEFVAPFAKARAWNIAPERYRRGIDNAHIDVYLSSGLRDGLRDVVRKLIERDLEGQGRYLSREPLAAREQKFFRDEYAAVFESISGRSGARPTPDELALLQISLLKLAIEVVADEKARLQQVLKVAVSQEKGRETGHGHQVHEQLVALTRAERAVTRRALSSLFRQIRELEDSHLHKVRESLVGEAWPFPRHAFFNPVLTVPDLDSLSALAPVYRIAALGERGDTEWLFQTNQCVATVFQGFLPAWTRFSSDREWTGQPRADPARERRDQGRFRGYLGTEMLLSRFVPPEEYQSGNVTWLDEPSNMRAFLAAGGQRVAPSEDIPESVLREAAGFDHDGASEGASYSPPPSNIGEFGAKAKQRAPWNQHGWQDFQNAVSYDLFRCLDLQGLSKRAILLYWLPAIGNELGRPVPLSLVSDFVTGRLSRRRLARRLDALRLALDPAAVARVLERATVSLKRLGAAHRAQYLAAYLTDFLVLRRDLKLAYKTYEAMDEVRLLEDPGEIQLSRANVSLYEFPGCAERPRSTQRVTAHAVLKADVRGSTLITEGLRAKGLNPASHFALNFFDPVNRLLADFGGEKVFVEGDAVIIAFFADDSETSAMTVCRACGLARKMLQVVSLQNAVNRKHALPELELGLGISFTNKEPNFLYDEGRRIMISEAINRADRLSSCASTLRLSGFAPKNTAFKIEVVRDTSAAGDLPTRGSLLNYNVNGIKLEKSAFFRLRREISLNQVELSDVAMGDDLFFAGSFPDLRGQEHWLILRSGPVREWNGRSLGPLDAERGRFFEVIADEALAARFRKQALNRKAMRHAGASEARIE